MARVTFRDNTDIILRKLAGSIGSAAKDCAETAVEAIQDKILYGYSDMHGNPPHTEIVETGATFDSISADVVQVSQNGFTVNAGAGTSYAKYVHDGTYKLKGRPFITDGLTEARPEIERAISDAIKRGMK